MNPDPSPVDILTRLALAVPEAENHYGQAYWHFAQHVTDGALTRKMVAKAELTRAWREASQDERTWCIERLTSLSAEQAARPREILPAPHYAARALAIVRAIEVTS